ncbi:MAG TPA: aldo/keto reductase family protein [Acidimicrobiia bacterium]|nr:aldo/keto reductase family protein [Acidimicrobiia bacterium]
MEYRTLGNSDLVVSEISLGSWLTYGVGVELDAATACLDRAFDLGINFFDTANAYGRGRAEEVWGTLLAGRPRDSYVLATKVYFPMSDADYGLSRAQITKQLDASLQRLQVDYVDLYQCHRYDEETPLEETMDALTDAVRQGKARYLGFSEWKPSHIEAAITMAEERGVERFVSSQPQYSILWRLPEKRVIPLSAANGISQIVWSPLAQGALTGKYEPGKPPPTESRAASESMGAMMGNWTDDAVLQAVQDLRPIAADAGLSMAQLALAWVLREPNVASAIIGASRPDQIDDNVGASGVKLTDEIVAAIDKVVGPVLQP